jgi:hypothetical protein
LFFKKVISFFYPALKNIKDKQQVMSEPIKQYEDDQVINESINQYDLKVPNNLRPLD